ncbi:MAG: DUF488 domain-containing protein [Tepidisphaeraceae bacterium]
MIKLKRAYEDPAPTDGERVLVERLWPRGVTKEKAAIHLWLKDIAPSTALRKWFDHDPAKWAQFKQKYWRELQQQADSVKLLRQMASKGTLTLVYAAANESCNGALALEAYLKKRKA